jgi:uncharacterized protein (TIGR04255 family)
MTRPAHLPAYDNPPVNEVVLGVQFATPKNYQQIYAGEVWGLFKNEFPKVKELEPLQPVFETFGLPQRARINLGIVTGARHDRYWFLSESEDHLIQFQNDRFLHNWRKVGEGKNPYPRFDEIVTGYEKEIKKLEDFFVSHPDLGTEPLDINQCELTYINHIRLMREGKGSRVDHWLSLASLNKIELDDFSLAYRKAIKADDNKPYARLICEISTGFNKKEESIIVMNLTIRGTPKDQNIQSALQFLKEAREEIVTCFDTITTKFAHEQWRKE